MVSDAAFILHSFCLILVGNRYYSVVDNFTITNISSSTANLAEICTASQKSTAVVLDSPFIKDRPASIYSIFQAFQAQIDLRLRQTNRVTIAVQMVNT